MAKSLRSKSKRAFRAQKRTDAKSDYFKTETARMTRLSKKLNDEANEEAPKDEDAMAEDVAEAEAEEMEVDEKKVSTSGPRTAGRRKWKEVRGYRASKTSKTGFQLKKRRGKDGRVKA